MVMVHLRAEFEQVDCIVFGHTHKPFCENIDGTFFFNPGSPFDNRFSLKNTIGYLELSGGEIKGRIVEL